MEVVDPKHAAAQQQAYHPPGDQPPSYERSASPSATAPSTVGGEEVDTGPRMIQPDHAYPHGQNYSQPHNAPSPSVSPPHAPQAGYFTPPPQGAQNMPQYQQPQHQQPMHPQAMHPQPNQSPGQVVGSVGQGQTYKNVTPVYALSSAPAPIECPACGARTLTRTTLKVGNTTNAWAAGVCLLTCLGCIPYCVAGTKDVEHSCGNCGAKIATWHRSGRAEVHMHS